jgi:hypothetical protein
VATRVRPAHLIACDVLAARNSLHDCVRAAAETGRSGKDESLVVRRSFESDFVLDPRGDVPQRA